MPIREQSDDSMVERLRRMCAPEEPGRAAEEEGPVILPDGYRRRTAVQRYRREPPRLRWWMVALPVALLALAAALCLTLYRLR